MNNPIALAVRGKRWGGMAQRMAMLPRRYGLGPGQMERQLARMVQVLADFGCPVTFPITATVLLRHAAVIRRVCGKGVEFAAHGYLHIDHADLSFEEQCGLFLRARRAFEECGIECHGFRAPYVRWNQATLAAIRSTGWLYDSSEAMAWTTDHQTATYRHAVEFYRARSASREPSLPRVVQEVVEIPVALPDDEAFVERLGISPREMAGLWISMLDETHARGELLVLNLHPERFSLCEAALVAVLKHAQQKRDRIWMARLDEIARWWRVRDRENAPEERWSGGAQSALCITGDIDALTLGDYALRALGR